MPFDGTGFLTKQEPKRQLSARDERIIQRILTEPDFLYPDPDRCVMGMARREGVRGNGLDGSMARALRVNEDDLYRLCFRCSGRSRSWLAKELRGLLEGRQPSRWERLRQAIWA